MAAETTPSASVELQAHSLTPSNEKKTSVDTVLVGDALEEPLAVDTDAERRLVRRIDLRVIPACMLIYVLSFLDRSNIGNAKILNSDTGNSLQQATHITNVQYLDALVIFFVAYSVFEIPSIILLKKAYPSRWFAFLMFGWGAMTMVQSSVSSFGGLAGVRFILGAFEAGFFPGIIYFLTFWYRPNERALRIALIAACATLGGAFGGAIAYGVGFINKERGIEGWRWLCIIEGGITCVLSFAALLLLPDYPETVRWLSPAERSLAVTRLQGDSPLGLEKLSPAQMRTALFDFRLYVHYAVFLCVSAPFSGFSLFTPTIVSGLGFEGLAAQLFTVPPFAAAFVFTVVVSWTADRYQQWSLPSFICLVLSGVSFIIQGALSPSAFTARYAMLCLATSFSFATNPLLLNYLTVNVRGTSAMTLGVPLNITLATAGQIIGLFIYKPEEAPGYPTGHYTNAALMLFAAVMVAYLRWLYARRNRNLCPGEKQWRV